MTNREAVYLRFGKLPKGGASRDGRTGVREGGVSVFRGYEKPEGRYVLDIPRIPDQSHQNQLILAYGLVLQGRPVYVASGAECGRGAAGEPVLTNVKLGAMLPRTSVSLPECLGPHTRKLEETWSRRRRPSGLREQTVLALEEALDIMFPIRSIISPQERRTNAEKLVGAFVPARSSRKELRQEGGSDGQLQATSEGEGGMTEVSDERSVAITTRIAAEDVDKC